MKELLGDKAFIFRRSDVVAMRRHVVAMTSENGQLVVVATGRTVDQAVEGAKKMAGKSMLKEAGIEDFAAIESGVGGNANP